MTGSVAVRPIGDICRCENFSAASADRGYAFDLKAGALLEGLRQSGVIRRGGGGGLRAAIEKPTASKEVGLIAAVPANSAKNCTHSNDTTPHRIIYK